MDSIRKFKSLVIALCLIISSINYVLLYPVYNEIQQILYTNSGHNTSKLYRTLNSFNSKVPIIYPTMLDIIAYQFIYDYTGDMLDRKNNTTNSEYPMSSTLKSLNVKESITQELVKYKKVNTVSWLLNTKGKVTRILIGGENLNTLDYFNSSIDDYKKIVYSNMILSVINIISVIRILDIIVIYLIKFFMGTVEEGVSDGNG